MEKTAHQKSGDTLKANKEKQRQKARERQEIKATIKQSLLSVVESKEAKPSEKLEASKLLLELI